jgi:anti-sigma factor RsiW
VRLKLELLVDADLDAALAAALRAHIARCRSCRAQHREAASVPLRLRALRSPAPPTSLIDEVMRRVAPRIRPLDVWGLLVPELLLLVVAAWYTSGVGGLVEVARRTASDVAAFVSWGTGSGNLPAPVPGDLFMLLVTLLLAAVTLWHLSLLARLPPNRARS